MSARIPTRPLVLPPIPDDKGLAEWRAKLALLPDEDEIDAAQEHVFRARDGLEFETRLFNLRRRWRLRGVDDAELGALESRWRVMAIRGEAAAMAKERKEAQEVADA